MENSFFECRFTIADHDDPSLDVSVCCYPGMILTVSVAVRTGISMASHRAERCERCVAVTTPGILPEHLPLHRKNEHISHAVCLLLSSNISPWIGGKT